MKRILVTGDWVADYNLARPDNLPEGYFDGSQETQLYHRAGGAWYLTYLIERITCRELTAPPAPSLEVASVRSVAESRPGLKADGTQRDDLAHAYSVWSKYRRLSSGKKDDQVWRIAQFLGCRKSSAWKPSVRGRQASRADGSPVAILVIDDLGLGFSERPEAFDHVTSLAGNKAKILLKHGVGGDREGILSQLLEHGLNDRLHVVAAASALRRRNASLSRALSWDQTLEDIEHEFMFGPSSRDLARCASAVVHFGLAGAAVFRYGRLHRFYFLPDELEGGWEEDHPGESFGTGSILTACLARHLLSPEDYPMFFAVTQALAAQRKAHLEGAGNGNTLAIDLAYGPRDKFENVDKNAAAVCIKPPQEADPTDAEHLKCVGPFRVAWNPADIAVWPEATAKGLKRNRLLCNVTGTTPDSLHAKAVEVVIQGTKQALASVPKASYEKYLTVDRDEIESINEIRRLILEYRSNPTDKRPLSVAVFGAPGSGKSFAIKQVAKAIFGKDLEPLEFNLTQIKTETDLHRAFQQVRDASIRDEIPLVFWDEFDTAGLKWLADFLAPMQDAEFFDGSHKHPFGKCIFVFAGGTCTTFEKFKQWCVLKEKEKWVPTVEDPWHRTFKDLKGPDFISRLRGFLNVKGPNPTADLPDLTVERRIAIDPAYVLRRAIVLRLEIERCYPHLIHPTTKRAAIAPNVLHASLSVERYEHGARSISAILGMSALASARVFTVSALPSADVLHLHVSRDFASALDDPASAADLHEPLARVGFEAWKIEKIRQGYVHGLSRNDDRKKPPLTHPLIKEWSSLTPVDKAGNYDPVWRRLLAIRRAGYAMELRSPRSLCLSPRETRRLIALLLAPEHQIWLADHLTTGYIMANRTSDHLRQHTDIRPFVSLPNKQKDLNRSIVTETVKAIHDSGFRLVRC